jgi:hypothetical protein
MVSTRRATVASRTLADQLRPIVHIHGVVRAGDYVRIDVERARARIRAGRVGFDATRILSDAGDLAWAFERTLEAFEQTGIASTPRVAALQKTPIDATAIVLAWANAESTPRDPMLRLARRVAGVIGNAILSRAASETSTGISLVPWKRPQCPCCGASPDLALATDSRRTLVCWRCDTRWRTDQRGCIGCGANGSPAIARVPSPYLGYELAICNSCGRYLKERRGALTHELLVERALTAGLDEAAQLRGLRA